MRFLSKDLIFLSLGFLFLGLGYSGVQNYLTTFFKGIGQPNLGFSSLILIYLFLAIASPFASLVVSRFGAKKVMQVSSIFYALFIISVISQVPVVVYFFSILLGVAASLAWTAQGVYLIGTSKTGSYGASSGFFHSLFSAGVGASGVAVVILADRLFFTGAFWLMAGLSALAPVFLFLVKNVPLARPENQWQLLTSSLKSPTGLRLSLIWFVSAFIFGLTISYLPWQIAEFLGSRYIGLLLAAYWFLTVFLSFPFGRLSDKFGRKPFLEAAFAFPAIGLVLLFFSPNSMTLWLAVILLALSRAILMPISQALIGDVTTQKNIAFITALFYLVQSFGVVLALIIATIFQSKMVYLFSVGVLAIVFWLLKPLLDLDVSSLKKKVSQEIN